MINTLLGHSIYTLTSATATAEMRGVVRSLSVFAICASLLSGCLSTAYEGIALSEPARVTVKYDMLHRPLPDIPLPNDIATRYDPQSATLRRVNASMIAPTQLESHIRAKIDELDGWGMMQPIAIPFTGEIDVTSILESHRDADYDPSDDVLYLIDITPGSPEYGELTMLDLGQGNYPLAVENRDRYFDADPRVDTLTIWLEEAYEDRNGDGVLNAGEDTDGDGVLDRPNYLPAYQDPKDHPARDDLAARYDAMMNFYERETNTLIAIPVTPLRPRTTYALVITKRLKDLEGESVGSPFDLIHHSAQGEPLRALPEALERGGWIGVEDIAFTFTFTTQSVETDYIAVRDGLYGHGVQKHLGELFPPRLKGVETLKDEGRFPSANMHILHAEEFGVALRVLHTQLRGLDNTSLALEEILDSNKYVDYYVIGSYEAPQLSPREDEDGNPLRMNDQSWPADLDRVPAPTRAETIYFTLVVPRKEVSARGQGKPAPVVILGHGHTGNRFDAVNMGPYFARHGLATIAIDNPGHGLGIPSDERAEVVENFKTFGISAFAEASFKDRARDLNYDGEIDSGADYWDFYMFHTRDNVRQTALDYMSLIRLINSFDGDRRWAFDLDQDGVSELAGDFDGDGAVDIGLGSTFTMSGGSLGGIMSMLMGTVEPHVKAIAPIVGAGGLGLVSRRSLNQNVRNAILARGMGPFYVVSSEPVSESEGETGEIGETGETGETGEGSAPATFKNAQLSALLPDLTESPKSVYLAPLGDLVEGDTLVMTNLKTGERRCGVINAEGRGRVPLPSDIGDPIKADLYSGNLIIGPDCELVAGASPREMIDRFDEPASYWNVSYRAGSPLKALAEGLGLLRASPEFRRFVGLGPLVMDRADPAVMGRHLQREPLVYPGTGEKTGAHALITTGTGDLNVPVDGGATFARAAGILEWREPHPAWGVPENQVLIDHYVLECVEEFNRYTDPSGNGVLMDPDNFSDDKDYWAGEVPRLDPPLRAGWDRADALDGRSALIHAYGSPKGRHGFDEPGVMTDKARNRCVSECPEGEECMCDEVEVFDVGNFHFNLIGAYLKSAGQELEARSCHATFDCDEIPEAPAERPLQDL